MGQVAVGEPGQAHLRDGGVGSGAQGLLCQLIGGRAADLAPRPPNPSPHPACRASGGSGKPRAGSARDPSPPAPRRPPPPQPTNHPTNQPTTNYATETSVCSA
jgi:hypothetical protein